MECPLFTSRHSHHSAVWSVTGYSFPKLCIACATERLENISRGELSVHIEKILGEFQALLGANAHACNREDGNTSLLTVLSADKRVLEHLCGLLFGLLLTEDGAILQSSLEVLMRLLEQTKDQTITRKLLQKTVQSVMSSQNFPSSLPHLNFLGQLLHSQPPLCTEIAHSQSNFLEFLLGVMSYPDETVKSSVVYILVQVCSKTQPNTLSVPLVQNMCRHISTNLAAAKSQELTVNLLGLVRHLLKSGKYTQCLLQADRLNSETKGSTFASAFKRVLLSRDELLQLSGVQCIAEVLAHHIDYGRVLLRADIAEFMFEALSSKNELLMNSLFYCLNSLASIDDFYSKYHVIYGIDPVLNGLTTVLRLRNFNAAQIGLSLLVKILMRQPSGMPLFKSHQSLQVLLSLLSTALQVQDMTVILQATSVLSTLLSVHHIPSGYPMSALLPLLARLLQLVEPLSSTSYTTSTAQLAIGTSVPQGGQNLFSGGRCLEGGYEQSESIMTPWMKRQLCEVLLCLERANRLGAEAVNQKQGQTYGGVYLDEEDQHFLSLAFEESLLPIVLLNMNHLDDPGPFTSIFNIAISQFALLSSEKCLDLARKLCETGFIQLVLELKAKFPNTATGFVDLCTSGNHFLERLCGHLERGRSINVETAHSLTYVTDILHQTLPHLNCTPGDCLQILSQRAGGLQLPGRTTGGKQGPANLQSMQATVLALFYYAYTHDDLLVAPCDLLKALNNFLSLNPNIHLLPQTTLIHLTVLYAHASDKFTNETSGNSIASQGHNITSGVPILVRGLQRIPDPVALFVPNTTLLKWSFKQWGRTNCIVKAWLIQWLILARDRHSVHVNTLMELVQTCSPVLQCILDVLSDLSEQHVDVVLVLDFVELLLNTCKDDDDGSQVLLLIYSSLQKTLVMQRVEPLTDSTLSAILKLLVKVQKFNDCLNVVNSDLKLIYHIVIVVSRLDSVGEVSSDTHDHSLTCSVAQYGMEFLVKSLMNQTPSQQVVLMLLNNSTFLQKIASFLPWTKSSKAHSLLSAVVMELIALLINLQHKFNINVIGSGPVLYVSTLTSALLSPSTAVQVAGLNVWRVVFSRGGEAGCFIIRTEKEGEKKSVQPFDPFRHVQLLTFLIHNSMVKGNAIVCKAAVLCFLELINYSSAIPHQETFVLSLNGVFLKYITDMYSTDVIPSYYISCINKMLNSASSNWNASKRCYITQLRSLAQLLHKSFLSYTESKLLIESSTLSQEFTACFKEIENLDKTYLDKRQWEIIHTKMQHQGL